MKRRSYRYENARQYLVSQERVILDIAMLSAERIIGQTLQDDEGSLFISCKKSIKRNT